MSLIVNYADVIEMAKHLGIQDLGAREENGKFVLSGKAAYAFDRDRLWDQIKTHPAWQNEVMILLEVLHQAPYGIYRVKRGDSLSAIAKSIYGEFKHYRAIFELNKDILQSPEHISPGQDLKLPDKALLLLEVQHRA